MEKVILAAQKRSTDGSRAANRIRRQGLIPAVVYGHGMTPVAVQVGTRELHKAIHTKAGANVIIDLNVADLKLKESTVLIKAIQHNPVTDEIAHIDFTVISMTEKIKVNVHIAVSHADESEGVKMGGVLDLVHHEVEVECLPTAIPAKIEVNVKALKMGESVHAKDLKLPEGVVCTLPADEVVVSVQAPRQEEVAAAPAEGTEPQQPEVIEKGKKDEDKEEGAAAPKQG